MQDETGFRWRLWSRMSDLPWVCPANAYGKIVSGNSDQPLRIGASCLDRTGTDCWCGKVGTLRVRLAGR